MSFAEKYWRFAVWLLILVILLPVGARAVDRLEDPERDWSNQNLRRMAFELVLSEDPACLKIVDALNQGLTAKGGLYADPIFVRWSYLIDTEEVVQRRWGLDEYHARVQLSGLEAKYLKIDAYNNGTAPLILKFRSNTAGFSGEWTILYEDVAYFEEIYWEDRYRYWGGSEGFYRLQGDPKANRVLYKYETSANREFSHFRKLSEEFRRTHPEWGGFSSAKQINFVKIDGRVLLLVREVYSNIFAVFLLNGRENGDDVCYIGPNALG